MSAPKTPACPRYADAAGVLTPEGRRWVIAQWKQCFVACAAESVELSDIEVALRANDDSIDWDAVDIDTASITAALLEAGARPDPGYEYFWLARERDELGAEDGALVPGYVEWLVDGLIPAGSVCLITAHPYALKTFVAMSLAVAVANHRPWLGRTVADINLHRDPAQPRRVVWAEYENAREVPRRLALLGDDQGRVFRSAPQVPSSDPKFWRGVERMRAALVCVDSLSRSNREVDENDPRAAEPLARAAELAAKHGTTSIFVSHSPKGTGRGLMEVIRGSSAIAAAADVVLHLEPVRFTSTDPMERRARIRCVKMKTGGNEPAPFVVRLTDAGGLELCDETPRRSKPAVKADANDEERVFAAIEANPGCSTKELATMLGMRRADVTAARRKLEEARRVRVEGAGPTTKIYAR